MRLTALLLTVADFAIGLAAWLLVRLVALILAVPLVVAIALYWLTYPVPSDRVRAVCGWPRKVIGNAFRKAAGLP